MDDKEFQKLARENPRAAMEQMGMEPTDAQVRLAESFPWHHTDALHNSFAKADIT